MQICKCYARYNKFTYPALLFGDQGTLPLVHNAALLGRNIFTHLILDSLALPLIDHLALGLGPGGALLLHDGRALLLVPGAALLVKFIRTFFLVDGLLDSPGKVDALDLRDRMAFLLELLAALLLDVVGSLAILLVAREHFFLCLSQNFSVYDSFNH